jgi:SSS family solute:Na+ symporter
LHALDVAVLIVYFAAMLALGGGFFRRRRSADRFMAGGRNLPAWVVGLSIFGTYVSSISYLALPGAAFAGDWNWFVFSLSLPLAGWLAIVYFVPFYRRKGAISAYEHLEARFGPWARTYALTCYLLTHLARAGTILYLLALSLAPLLGWDMPWIIIATGAVVTFYSLLGGIEGVIWTDVVQSVVLIAGALVAVGLLLGGMPDGPTQVFEIGVHHDKFSLGNLGPDLTRQTFWVVLAYGLLINLQNFGIDQSFVQRYMTARSDSAAQRSVWLTAILYPPVSAVFLFIGTALFAFYSAWPERLPADLRQRPDGVFPWFILTEMPAGLRGLVIAGIFSAAMSATSGILTSSATLFLCDIWKRHVSPKAGDRESVRVLYTATFVVGALGTAAALAMIPVRGVLEQWWKLAGVFSGGMLGLFLLGLVTRFRSRLAPAAATLAGILVIIWMTLSNQWTWFPEPYRSPFHTFLTIVFGTLTILSTGFVLSWLIGKRGTQSAECGTQHCD